MTAFRCVLGVWFVLGWGLSVQAAETKIQVNEAGSKATIEQQSLHLELEVESLGAAEFPVILRLHLLGIAQDKLAEVKVQTSLPPGMSLVGAEITLPFDTHQARNLEKLLWSRIQYQIVTSEPSTPEKLAEGVFSVSRVAQDVVRLRIQPPLQFTAWKDYRPRVLAVHPTSLRPLPGVEITADIVTDRQILARTNIITNQDGYAELVFRFPPDLEDTNWAKLKVTGKCGKNIQTTEIQIRRSNDTSMVFTSDKTIYNPGDVVQLNWFAVDNSQRPLAGTQWSVQIEADNQVVFETQQTASSIGHATLDWRLPEAIKPGEYSIYLQEVPTHPRHRSSRPEPLQQSLSIVVAPKPRFLIQLQSDQKRYLRGSAPAVIRVQASQHTGQALAGARVLLAWEYSGSRSEWNHRLQTWEGKPVQFVKGQCDAQGQCQIQLPLDRLWIDRQTTPDQTVLLTAYVTDPRTGQVENQEIRLRLEEKLIKIKVIGHPADNIEGQPVQFTILTTYADDTPASCRIDLFQHVELESWGSNPLYLLMKSTTNQYGIKRISWQPPGPQRPGIRLTIKAQDSQGNQGTETIWCRFLNKPVVRIETDRSLYQTGQPLVVTLRSNCPDLTVWLTVINPSRVISSQLVHLVDGKTRVLFPYSPDLVGKVTILTDFQPELSQTYAGQEVWYSNQTLHQSLSIPKRIHPGTQNLRSVYFPNVEPIQFEKLRVPLAQVSDGNLSRPVMVFTTGDQPSQEAFSILVDPMKVEENQFSDLVQTFIGSYLSFSSKLSHPLNQVAGWTRSDLQYLDQTQRSDSQLDELAEVLLHHTNWEDLDWRSQSENEEVITSIQVQMNQQLSSLIEIMGSVARSARSAKPHFPTTESELNQLARHSGLNLDTCLDPWGTAYQFEFTEAFPRTSFQVRSAGPDEIFSTRDDILVGPVNWYTFALPERKKLYAVLEQAQKENIFWLSPEEFKKRAAQNGVSLDQMTDPWGIPLVVRVQMGKTGGEILLLSTGANRTLDSVSETPGDDSLVWRGQIIYSFQQSALIHSALKKFILRSGRLPTTEAEVHQALALNGSTLDQFRDPMQHPFRVKFEYRTYDQSGKEVWLPVTTPVDPNLLYRKNTDDGHFQISLISDGRDGQPGTEDDFRAFSSSLYEAICYGMPQISHPAPMKHGIYGMVFDLEGKPLSDVLIVANPISQNTKTQARSDAQGRFVIPGQSQGTYELRFSLHPKNPQNQLVAAATTPFQTYAGANSEGSGFLQVQLFDPTSPQTKDLRPKQGTGVVYGQITDTFTGLPIPLATIEFNNLEQNHKYVTTSNLKGQFALRSVSNGVYSLTALKYGFSQLNLPEIPVLADRNTHLPLTLTPDPNAARIPDSNQIQAILKKGTGTGTLAGVVQGDNHSVIPNARVTAVDVHSGLLFAANTDESGCYAFPSLPIGEYQVTVSAKQYYDFTAVEVIIVAQQSVRLDAELIFNTGDCIAIHHTVARSSPPPDCYWTRPVQAGGDGKFRFAEIPSAGRLQNWKQVIVVLMKDGSVRWVVR